MEQLSNSQNDQSSCVTCINKIQTVLKSERLTSEDDYYLWALIELEDKRIATGDFIGFITINSINLKEKKWKKDIIKTYAHNHTISSFCLLKGNRLVSSSRDKTIRIWSVSSNHINCIKVIKVHKKWVYNVISLTEGRFASCSGDRTIRIWEDNSTYQELSILQHDDCIRSIIQLKGKNMLVSCCESFLISGVSFWDINSYLNLNTIKGYAVDKPTHMVALSDGNVAISNLYPGETIVVINSSTFEIMKVIQEEGYIVKYSSLFMYDQFSFIYVHRGTFLQISSEDYSVIFKSIGGDFDGYYGGIISIEDGKYLAIPNGAYISIIKAT